jgi:predicted DsbA family dithiol-disulfide isomerase
MSIRFDSIRFDSLCYERENWKKTQARADVEGKQSNSRLSLELAQKGKNKRTILAQQFASSKKMVKRDTDSKPVN